MKTHHFVSVVPGERCHQGALITVSPPVISVSCSSITPAGVCERLGQLQSAVTVWHTFQRLLPSSQFVFPTSQPSDVAMFSLLGKCSCFDEY